MVKVVFFPMDISYNVKKIPIISMYGRTADGRQIRVMDRNARPYFFVVPKMECEDLIPRLKSITEEDYCVTDVEETIKIVDGKTSRALKVFVNLPKGVPVIRSVIKDDPDVQDTREYDILFVRRYLVDNGIIPFTETVIEGEWENGMLIANSIRPGEKTLSEPRILGIDIETYIQENISFDADKNPILMVAFHGEDEQKVITWKKFRTKEKYVEFVEDEKELLKRCAEYIREKSPDVITGYYSDGFDFPYIKKRAKKFNVPFEVGLDGSPLSISGRTRTEARIEGIVHIDILQFIRRVVGRSMKAQSYSLNEVAHELLGEKKVDVDISRISEAWDECSRDLELFCRYNLQDARLAHSLCRKLLPNLIEMVKLMGLPLFDVSRMSFSQLVEWFIFRKAFGKNWIVPNKPGYREISDRKMRRYEGGFVFTPKPGLYENIMVFDFRSLYPTIIASHNISPEMLNCGCCGKTRVPIDDEIYWFCEKNKGFLPEIIQEIVARRAEIKNKIRQEGINPFLEAQNEGLKVLSNSFYGYLGFFAARWYSFPCGRSITAWGRWYIHQVIEKAEKKGLVPIYSDTDSIFLQLGNQPKESALKFVKEINESLPGIMELEYEGYFPSGIFVSVKLGTAGAKKRYALLSESNDIIVKGFEVVRRNTSPIAKEVQKKVLNLILREKNSDAAVEYVKKIISRLRNHEISLEKVTITTQLQKNIGEYDTVGPHVAAAKLMKDAGFLVGPGTNVKYVVALGVGRIKDRVRLPNPAELCEYDAEYYIENQVLPSVESIFGVLDIDIAERIKNDSQHSLDSYFS